MEQAMGMTCGHGETLHLVEQLLQRVEGISSPAPGDDHPASDRPKKA
jgi:hypothetical protein